MDSQLATHKKDTSHQQVEEELKEIAYRVGTMCQVMISVDTFKQGLM